VGRPTPPETVACIEALRRQRWTGAQIARETGVSKATVSRILRRLGLNRLRSLEPAERSSQMLDDRRRLEVNALAVCAFCCPYCSWHPQPSAHSVVHTAPGTPSLLHGHDVRTGDPIKVDRIGRRYQSAKIARSQQFYETNPFACSKSSGV